MNYDVVVAGAGITGLSTAYHLQAKDQSLRILVVDKAHTFGQGNTGRSAAKVRDTFTSTVSIQLSQTSIDAYRAIQDSGIPIGLDFRGYLWLMSLQQMGEKSSLVQKMIGNHVEVRIIGSDELQRHMPMLKQSIDYEVQQEMQLGNAENGLFGVNCGSIDPLLLAEFYASEFIRNGGQILYDTKATGFIFSEDGEQDPNRLVEDRIYGIKTQNGNIFAGKTVAAVNSWSRELLEPSGIMSYIYPQKRQLFHVNSSIFDNVKSFSNGSGPAFPFTILPHKGIYLYTHGPTVTIGYADYAGRPISHEEDPQGDPSMFKRKIMPIVAAYFPGLQNAPGEHADAGYYDYSLDGVPVIHEPVINLIIAVGLSGRGIMHADAVGRVTASKVLEEKVATLFPKVPFKVSRLSGDPAVRNVDKEEWII